MGLFEKIFGKWIQEDKTKNPQGKYQALTVYEPEFTSFSGKIYESELVRAAVNAIASNVAKLKVEFYGHGSEALGKRLKNPNIFQTWSQFLYRTATIYEVDNTVFIIPVFDKYNRVTEIYPVIPWRTKIVQINNEPWMAFEFGNGKIAQLPVWQVGMLTKFQYKNDFFGEPNNALTPTMDLINIQNQGIQQGIREAATYRFMAQYNNLAFQDDLEEEQEKFNKRAAKRGGLALLFPKNYENIRQIDSKPFVADAEQMKAIENNVFNYFGVNTEVLQNKSYSNTWSAFYEGKIELFGIQFSEVMTRMLQMCGQISGDAGVMTTANRMQFMSNNEKLNVSSQMADRGILNRDEVREIWNLPPLPNGEGKKYIIRGEYKDATEHIKSTEEETENE